MAKAGSKRRSSRGLAALLVLALPACGGGDDVTTNNAAGIPAEVATQSQSNLAAEPAEPVPGLSWRIVPGDADGSLQLVEPEGTVSLTLTCGGTPARLSVAVPGFTPSRTGEPMRLAIGTTEIALAPIVEAPGARGSVAEGSIPPNLAELMADAAAIDVVQGVQRIGSTPPPPRDTGQAFAGHCIDLLG
ncbi:hypothetical protein GGR88_002344 [Sphingomonas jejuensis]|uniref:Lipoprotein n=1 Tax=Sphingomonas jejuensis TaxID=904715 RepID=A0ABX0XNL6_9SPHN|nr:hypothetical protein [Sphingomonas jejuensis]NJC34830.1 hypothetical protein [Sphingomonas jejuensis]